MDGWRVGDKIVCTVYVSGDIIPNLFCWLFNKRRQKLSMNLFIKISCISIILGRLDNLCNSDKTMQPRKVHHLNYLEVAYSPINSSNLLIIPIPYSTRNCSLPVHD